MPLATKVSAISRRLLRSPNEGAAGKRSHCLEQEGRITNSLPNELSLSRLLLRSSNEGAPCSNCLELEGRICHSSPSDLSPLPFAFASTAEGELALPLSTSGKRSKINARFRLPDSRLGGGLKAPSSRLRAPCAGGGSRQNYIFQLPLRARCVLVGMEDHLRHVLLILGHGLHALNHHPLEIFQHWMWRVFRGIMQVQH